MFKFLSDEEDHFPHGYAIVFFFALGMILSLLFQNLMAAQDIVTLLDEQRRMFTAAARRELAHAASQQQEKVQAEAHAEVDS